MLKSMLSKYADIKARREDGEGGFTLIELLVVVVIIGILVAIAIPLYLNYTQGAKNNSLSSDVRNAVVDVNQCMAANNQNLPTTANAGGATGFTQSGQFDATDCPAVNIVLSAGTKMLTYTYTAASTTGTGSSAITVPAHYVLKAFDNADITKVTATATYDSNTGQTVQGTS